MAPDMLPDIPQVVYNGNNGLNRAKHIAYWKRCLRTFLPHVYTSTDSYRLMLGYFAISAMELLDVLESDVTEAERQQWIEWIYSCQTPDGGFRGSSMTDLKEQRTAKNRQWDPPSVPATYFALSALLLLGDALGRVDRASCLTFLNKMQRADGSFGETLGEDGNIEGGMDTRFGYTATGIRWILRGRAEGEIDGVPDIDVDRFVKSLRCSETYDGGISELPYHEAHAGYTFCAIAALYFVGRLPTTDRGSSHPDVGSKVTGLSDPALTIRWLLSRQTTTFDEEDEEGTNGDETDTRDTCHDAHSTVMMHEFASEGGAEMYKNRPARPDIRWVGFNGRCNKIADTCYTWWVVGALDILQLASLCDTEHSRRYLLDKTQHAIGGFGKVVGWPPDIYHSYLGLAALSVLDHQGLKKTHPAACFSWDAVRRLESLPWRRKVWDTPEEQGSTNSKQ